MDTVRSTVTPISVSLTQFVNFAMKPGPQQLTAVRAIKKQHSAPYSVPPDLYKQFRECVIGHHRPDSHSTSLEEIAAIQTEPSRRTHYPPLVRGYKAFLGRRSIQWFEPLHGRWCHEELYVNVRPELGLVVDGIPTLIKLQLANTNDMDKRRADVIAHLIRMAIPDLGDTIPGVLDVRKGRLFTNGKSDDDQTALLRGHAASLVTIYHSL